MPNVEAPPAGLRARKRGHYARTTLVIAGLGLLGALAWSSQTAPTGGERPGPQLRIRTTAAPIAEPAPEGRIDVALRTIAGCREAYRRVVDYTCTFVKRERLDGETLSAPHVMAMKARTDPGSVYFKFVRPKPGREAIFIAGKHGGKTLVHDVGLAKLLAGTLALDPRGGMAMDDSRHPITEAGLGHLIETISGRWAGEMREGETRVDIDEGASVEGRPCTLIESTHPHKRPGFLFHTVKVFIDRELNLPIRFEAYDWPASPGSDPLPVEEYTYRDLKLNVGLTDLDFDPANPRYHFGRF